MLALLAWSRDHAPPPARLSVLLAIAAGAKLLRSPAAHKFFHRARKSADDGPHAAGADYDDALDKLAAGEALVGGCSARDSRAHAPHAGCIDYYCPGAPRARRIPSPPPATRRPPLTPPPAAAPAGRGRWPPAVCPGAVGAGGHPLPSQAPNI